MCRLIFLLTEASPEQDYPKSAHTRAGGITIAGYPPRGDNRGDALFLEKFYPCPLLRADLTFLCAFEKG